VEIVFNAGVLAEKLERLEEAEEAYSKAHQLGLEKAKANLVNVGAKRKIKQLEKFSNKQA
jgi:hypothetical protein